MQRGSASRFALRSLFASCGMFRRETPVTPPDSLRLRPGGRLAEKDVVDGNTCPFRCFALCAKGAPLWLERRTWLSFQLVPGVFLERFPTTNYPWHTCAKACWCYTCNCCFRAGWNSPLAVNRAVPKGRRGAGKVPATEPMSPRPVCALVRMPAELVRSQYQRLESG